MRFKGLILLLILFVSIAAVAVKTSRAQDHDGSRLAVKAASAYPHHQTSEKVTIAAQPLETDEEAHQFFGKVNPYRLGVLPVLVVIQNDGPRAIRIEGMRVYYVLPDRTRIESTAAQELKYIHGAKEPKGVTKPLGGIGIGRSPRNPLAEWEIEGRAFAAKMIPAGQAASGFVYFQVPHSSQAASVYISGLEDAVTGNELYYFEIPMSGN